MIPEYFDSPKAARDWVLVRIGQERSRLLTSNLTREEKARVQGAVSGLVEALNVLRALHPEYVHVRTGGGVVGVERNEFWVGRVMEGPDVEGIYVLKTTTGTTKEVRAKYVVGPAEAEDFLSQKERGLR